MLSNTQLEELADNYGIELNGIHMKDELKGIKPRNGNYIINLESSTECDNTHCGTHWLLLIVKNKNCLYFDPFGVLPPTAVIDFCKRIPNSTLGYSTKEIQHIDADTCGWFGLGLLIFLKYCKIQNMYLACSKYSNMFSDDTMKNNSILQSYFKSISKKKISLLNILFKEK